MATSSLHAQRQITLNATPDEVWQRIGDFNGLHLWHPAVNASQLLAGSNNQAGAERLLTLGNGATIHERLLEHSDSQRLYRYGIIESPLPVRDYQSLLRVEPAPDGQALVTWQAEFVADGASDEEVLAVVEGIYADGLHQLRQLFAS